MAFNPMSKKDRKPFQEMGLLKDERKAKSWSLVYVASNKSEIVEPEKTYALCRFKRNNIENEP